MAESYTATTAVAALKKNASSEKDRIIMEAGTFKTCHEAFEKSPSIEPENVSTIGYTKGAGFRRGQFRQDRGAYHKRPQYNQRYGYNMGPANNQQYDRNPRWNGRGSVRKFPAYRNTIFIRQVETEENPKNDLGRPEHGPEEQQGY